MPNKLSLSFLPSAILSIVSMVPFKGLLHLSVMPSLFAFSPLSGPNDNPFIFFPVFQGCLNLEVASLDCVIIRIYALIPSAA